MRPGRVPGSRSRARRTPSSLLAEAPGRAFRGAEGASPSPFPSRSRRTARRNGSAVRRPAPSPSFSEGLRDPRTPRRPRRNRAGRARASAMLPSGGRDLGPPRRRASTRAKSRSRRASEACGEASRLILALPGRAAMRSRPPARRGSGAGSGPAPGGGAARRFPRPRNTRPRLRARPPGASSAGDRAPCRSRASTPRS